MAPLKLFPAQESHVDRLVELAARNPVFMDLSMLGTGKTYTSSALALRLAKEQGLCARGVIVIANVSILPKWHHMAKAHGIPILHALSYAAVRGRRDCSASNGLLIRTDIETLHRTRKGDYLVVKEVLYDLTETCKKLIDDGVLLILDEVQNIKNHGSDQHTSCCALLRAVCASKNSRAILMSGSPIDKEEQVAPMLQAMGLLGSHTSLCTYDIGQRVYDYGGMRHLLTQCEKLPLFSSALKENAELAHAIRSYQNARSCLRAAYLLFQKVVKPSLCAAMLPPQESKEATLHKYNGMFKLEDKETRRAIACAIEHLAEAAKYNLESNTVQKQDAKSMGEITVALKEIETLKVDTFHRLAHETLTKDPHAKVVVCLNYHESIRRLKDLLGNYKPLVMTGNNTVEERQRIIDAFQRPDDTHRVLIGNLTVMSTGIDLDDKHGGRPRTCFVSPMFGTITLYQLGHRFKRLDTHVDACAHLYMVYIEGLLEANIINALIRKGMIMKETVQEQADIGVVFPCDYPTFEE